MLTNRTNPPQHHCAGFTLIELLVVIAIIATLTGMILASGSINREKAGLRVDDAAHGVERMLLQARNLAVTTGQSHGVVFHIENATKGTGKALVLRNGDPTDIKTFPGRHWCAIIGPGEPSMQGQSRQAEIPYIAIGFHEKHIAQFGSAQRLAATVEKCQIGERYYLPRGTRFLALGDAEDNLNNKVESGSEAWIPFSAYYANWWGFTALDRFQIKDWSVSTKTRAGGVGGLSDTYPRAWFGFLAGPGGVGAGPPWTLNTWGGYDTSIFGSGLDYECTNQYASGSPLITKPINDSTNGTNNPADLCICRLETGRAEGPTVNGMGEPLRPCCDVDQLGKPRPLINGYWEDFMVVFLANGESRCVTFFNRNNIYAQAPIEQGPGKPARTYGGDLYPNTGFFRASVEWDGWSGIPEYYGFTAWAGLAKADVEKMAYWYCWPRFYGRDDGIIVLENSVLGGTTITVAKDGQPKNDNATFSSADEALQSILPLRRVVINDSTGGVKVIKPYSSISHWLKDQERDIPAAQKLWGVDGSKWQWCTAAEALDPTVPNKIRVSGALTAEMLLQRDPYPWIKPKP